MTAMIHSLERILTYDFELVFCPHNGIVENGKHAFREKMNNVLELVERAQTLHKKGMTVSKIRDRLLGKEGPLAYASGFRASKVNYIKKALDVEL